MRLQAIDFLSDHPAVTSARLHPEWLYTTRRYPLYWHHIAKNGGTFFKHFLHDLDHDQPFQGDSGLHDWDNHLIRPNGTDPDTIRTSAHSLIILRNPVRRLLSVYFDKVYHGSRPRPPGMSREFFETHALDQSDRLDPKGHTANLGKLVDWTARNIKGQTRTPPNWHLVPQMHQIAQVHALNFRALTLEDFDWQFHQTFSDLIPDLDTRLTRVRTRNRSTKPIRPSDILTPDLQGRIKQIYQDDLRCYQKVRRFWRDAKDGG